MENNDRIFIKISTSGTAASADNCSTEFWIEKNGKLTARKNCDDETIIQTYLNKMDASLVWVLVEKAFQTGQKRDGSNENLEIYWCDEEWARIDECCVDTLDNNAQSIIMILSECLNGLNEEKQKKENSGEKNALKKKGKTGVIDKQATLIFFCLCSFLLLTVGMIESYISIYVRKAFNYEPLSNIESGMAILSCIYPVLYSAFFCTKGLAKNIAGTIALSGAVIRQFLSLLYNLEVSYIFYFVSALSLFVIAFLFVVQQKKKNFNISFFSTLVPIITLVLGVVIEAGFDIMIVYSIVFIGTFFALEKNNYQ